MYIITAINSNHSRLRPKLAWTLASPYQRTRAHGLGGGYAIVITCDEQQLLGGGSATRLLRLLLLSMWDWYCEACGHGVVSWKGVIYDKGWLVDGRHVPQVNDHG